MHHLLEAFCQLAGRMPDAVCLLVGGTNDPKARAYVESLHARVAKHNLGTRVIFTGYRKDVPDLVRLMDVVVHPSESENCPRAVIEAQACGRPVVGFLVGGMPEVVREGQTGLLVKPFDTAALAGAIEQLLSDEPLRQQMGSAAKKRARDLYDLKRNVAAVIDLLEHLGDDACQSS
jgi:glycosyltransferase involved in cell wall biosynthesis